MTCICGDTACPSCGRAQGTYEGKPSWPAWSTYGSTLWRALAAIREMDRALAKGQPWLGVNGLCSAQSLLGNTLHLSMRWHLRDVDDCGAGRASRGRVMRAVAEAQVRFEEAIREFEIPACCLCGRVTTPTDRLRFKGRPAHTECAMREQVRRKSARRLTAIDGGKGAAS